MRARHLVLCSLATWIASASAAECCTIPVFRFALDRWENDRFRLVLPPDVASQPAVVDLLRPLRAGGKANLDVITAREALAGTPASLLFHGKGATMPPATVWSGAFTPDTFSTLLDSPARQKLVSRLLAGDSVVWVVASAASPESDADMQHIEERLRFLEQAAALPIQDPNDPDSQLGPGPELLLRLGTQHVRLDDPAEKTLISMLAGPDGRVDPAKPFAAAVFARGRVLGAWPLSQLDDAALEEACMFLIGRCSCRVKNQNPGWDILLNVDWENALRQADATRRQSRAGAATDPKSRGAPAIAPVFVSSTPARPTTVTSPETKQISNLPLVSLVTVPATTALVGSPWLLAVAAGVLAILGAAVWKGKL